MSKADHHFGVAPDIDHYARAFKLDNPEPIATSGPFERPATAREWATETQYQPAALEIRSHDRETGKDRHSYFLRRRFPWLPARWDKCSAPTFRTLVGIE